jgi:hypothetical protein
MLRHEVVRPPSSRYGAPPTRSVVQHPSGIIDICAIICSDRYRRAEQLFRRACDITGILWLWW